MSPNASSKSSSGGGSGGASSSSAALQRETMPNQNYLHLMLELENLEWMINEEPIDCPVLLRRLHPMANNTTPVSVSSGRVTM